MFPNSVLKQGNCDMGLALWFLAFDDCFLVRALFFATSDNMSIRMPVSLLAAWCSNVGLVPCPVDL